MGNKSRFEIRNIRNGKGDRKYIIYAELYEDNQLSVCATLDYIYDVLKNKLLTSK